MDPPQRPITGPLPPFTCKSAIQKVRLPKMSGTLATQGKLLWATRSTVDGETAQSSSTDGRKSSPFCPANGQRNWTTGSSRSSGPLPETALPCASLTSGTTTRVTGIVLRAMRTGNTTKTGLWLYDMRPSMTFPFWNQIANITGRPDAGLMIIPD